MHITDDDIELYNFLKFKDASLFDVVVRVLGLLCDNQYQPMQNYLQQQPGKIKSILLVSETCTLLKSLCGDITIHNINLINSVLQTLLEMSVVS